MPRSRTKTWVAETRQLLRSLCSATARLASAQAITQYVAGTTGTRTTTTVRPLELLPARSEGTERPPASESFALFTRSLEK